MGDEPSWIANGVHGLAELNHPLSPLSPRILFYPPLYPYFIAVPYRITGSLTPVLWLQMLVGALLVPAVGLLGASCFSPRTGLIAATMVAFYPELVWFAAHFWSETLFLTLLFWGLERTVAADDARDRPAETWAAVAAGLLLGFASLTRETALPGALLAAGWLAWPQLGRVRWRQGALLLAGTLLVVTPWTLRNWKVFGAFVPISTYGALNLWLGNTDVDRDEVYRLSNSVEGPIAQHRLAREEARKAIARRQPAWILEKTVRELPKLFAPSSEAIVFLNDGAYGPVHSATRAAVSLAIAAPWVVLALLGVPALALLELTRPRALLVAYFTYYVLVHVVAFGHHRFHLPLLPVLMLFAVAVVREPKTAPARWWALAAGLLLVVSACLAPSIWG
jgi:hypothetical protein